LLLTVLVSKYIQQALEGSLAATTDLHKPMLKRLIIQPPGVFHCSGREALSP
jgi:hypothetical protein